MRNNEPEMYLDDKQWSPLWETYLKEAVVFDPFKVHEINCILPLPERSGVLIFTDSDVHFSNMNALKTLHQFSSIHSFSDYQVLSSSLKELGHFGKYKMPWVCPYFALFPLESREQTTWINPITIKKIFKANDQYYAQMTNDLCLLLPVHRRRFVQRAEIACLLLATIRRGVLHFGLPGDIPLDFLYFPNTSFAKTLSKRSSLKEFRTPVGEINRLYQQTYSLYHCEPFMYDPDDSDHIDWL
ncbi:hypothetical protein JZO81_17790 [Enterococcus hulanensis]|uniref:hypothetical protein n=1 Tax=Enterococcus TaxID=1350 RepID=UPI000B5A8CF6|nr:MULTISPECIES: hypothetical protein [Enterococcus]MBO0412911.1 hypothetical protein [Enterococcus hulanensis]OTO21867.1 hypothetical protein A5875_003249 [Enterococcus sp. 3H8_DIV0648]